MMGGGMMGGRPSGRKPGVRRPTSRLRQRRSRTVLQKKRDKALAGREDDEVADEEAKEEAAGSRRAFQRSDQGPSMGCDHGCVRSRAARRRTTGRHQEPGVAHPNYAHVDLERQTKQPDGSWSGWEAVSSKENLKILDNLPEVEEDELTPETVRPEALVDPLPFLKQGLWEKVHVGSLVPKEKKEIKKTELGSGGYAGAMMGGGMTRLGGSGSRRRRR